ncbi:MAG: ABC transporter permease [Acidobacteria bacterium]|nr:ABC transporter permease [Acidobacteriota bacterium]
MKPPITEHITNFYYKRVKAQKLTLLGPVILWLGLFFICPITVMLLYSFASRGEYGGVEYIFGLWNYLQSFNTLYLMIYWRSIWIAGLTTIVCLLVSYPVAYFIALKVDKKWKSILLILAVVPFWTSFLIRTYAWMMLLRTEGLLNSLLLKLHIIDTPFKMLYTDWAVLIGLIYGELPFMILPLYASLEKLDTRLLEAAMDLGANRIKTFLKVTVPLSKVGIITGIILVFIPSLGAFVTPDVLGGAKSIMIGNLIQNQFVQRNQPFGAALSFLLTALVLILLWIGLRAGVKVEEK